MQINHFKIVIPFSPDSINRVITYGKKEGDIVVLKHKWQKLAHLAIDTALEDGNLPPKFKGKIGVLFKCYFEYHRNRDGDNYTAMCKGIIDALVQKRMIKDDNSEYVDDNGRRLLVDDDRPRVEVFITERIPGNELVSLPIHQVNPGYYKFLWPTKNSPQ